MLLLKKGPLLFQANSYLAPKMGRLKKLGGETILYGLSSIVGRFLNYLLFPLHTLVMQTDSYGIVSELYAMVAFLGVIFLYGMETAFFRFATKEKEKEKTVFNTAVTSVLFSSLLLSVLFSSLATPIVNAMGYDGKEHYIYLFAAILALDAFLAIPFARLRLQGKARTFAAAKFLSILFNIGINVFFLYFCEETVKGKMLEQFQPLASAIYDPALKVEYVFIANLAANLSMFFILFRSLRGMVLGIDRALLGRMLSFGYPVLFTSLALVTNEMLSRWALKYWLPDGFYPGFTSQQVLGIFSGVYKLAIIMNLGVQTFRYAAEPFFFSKAKDKDSPQLFSKTLDVFVLFGCIVMVGVGTNLDILQYLLRNEDYRVAIHIVPLLLLANLFMGVNYNLSAWYKLIDFTKAGAYITITGALLTVLLNWILIPIYGYNGCAMASMAVYFSMCVMSYTWSRSYNPIPYHVSRIMIHIIIAFSITVLMNLYTPQGGITATGIHIALLVAYVAGLYLVERKGLLDGGSF